MPEVVPGSGTDHSSAGRALRTPPPAVVASKAGGSWSIARSQAASCVEWRSASTTAARHDDGGALVRQVRLPHEQDHTQPPPWARTFGWWWAGSGFRRPALERWVVDVRMASSGWGRVEVFP
jgi:hypothetical protein